MCVKFNYDYGVIDLMPMGFIPLGLVAVHSVFSSSFAKNAATACILTAVSFLMTVVISHLCKPP